MDEDARPRGGSAARAASFRCAVTLVDDPALVDPARERLIRRYRDPDATLPRTPGTSYAMCVLTPERVTAWDFAKG